MVSGVWDVALVLVVAGAAWIISWVARMCLRRARFVRLVDKLPGPPAYPIIGSCLDLLGVPKHKLLEVLLERYGKHVPIFRTWLGPMPMVHISGPEYLEVLLSSSKHLEKGYVYRLLHPWLGTGLLTSSGDKWRHRRKLITPAFHFSILHNFVEVFAEKSAVLVQRLQRHADGQPFDIFPLVDRCVLDIICETAMGTKINAQDEKDSEYVSALHGVSEEVAYRTVRPWLHLDCVYFRTASGKRMKKSLKVIHDFARKMIAEKRIKLAAKLTQQAHQQEDESMEGKKRRAAFLDLLVETSTHESLTDEDIREEVDTFMFEGYDTTTVAIAWSLFLLGLHPEIQARVAEEQHSIFHDSDRAASMQDLQDMQYLAQVIKEALRLYPSVHFISRTLPCDLQLGEYTVPAGCAVTAMIYHTHRDPRHFPNPDVFDPDNFSPERIRSRHPYAYVPFSAGPRNCIGQKFAMLEEKMVLSTVLRHYELRSMDRGQGALVTGVLIMRPASGIKMVLTPRTPPPQ